MALQVVLPHELFPTVGALVRRSGSVEPLMPVEAGLLSESLPTLQALVLLPFRMFVSVSGQFLRGVEALSTLRAGVWRLGGMSPLLVLQKVGLTAKALVAIDAGVHHFLLVALHMALKIAGGAQTLATLRTVVDSDAQMNLLVLFEGVIAGEDLPTDGTFELRPLGMSLLVGPQGAGTVEPLAAVRATVEPLVAVDRLVAPQMCRSCEGFSTFPARERSFVTVRPLVHLQRGPEAKALLAKGALVVPHCRVDPLVPREVTPCCEALLALVALVGLLSCMNVLVRFEAVGMLEGLAAVRAFVRRGG